VRGEGIAGTMSPSDDTPATSDSDAKSKSKRKRDAGADSAASKKSKKDKKDKKKDKKAGSESDVAKKLAKLSVDEKKSYEERAQAKGQSLEEYVRRRIQKKDEQRAARYVLSSLAS
jgi:nucleolar protein TMA23